MHLTLQTICTIKTALGIAKLQRPNDVRFVLAYQELVREWASDVDEQTAALIDASRGPALLKQQV
jgi:hypothetical protein